MLKLKTIGIWSGVLLIAAYLLVELPSPRFKVHTKGAVLISGASSGIGLDAATAVMQAGFHVFAGVRKENDKAAILHTCQVANNGQRCAGLTPVILDVTKDEDILHVFNLISMWTEQSKQPFVALVNNAGIVDDGVVELTSLARYRELFEVNFFGLVALTQKFLPLLRKSQGRIINISSVNGFLANGGKAAYVSSKFAVEGFSDSLRKELRPLGVAVSLVNPGFIETKMTQKVLSEIRQEKISQEWLDLYGRYYKGREQRTINDYNSGYTTQVTNDAIVDAITSSSPNTRYFVAGAAGWPSFLLAFFIRVVPTNLMDIIIESSN